MKRRSIIQQRGRVSFPEFLGERFYMEPFFKRDGLPGSLSRWQPTVDAMLDGIETDQPIYIMVDEAFVPAGQTHRRPGVHIDGYWNPALQTHSGFDGGHGYSAPSHGYTPPSYERVITNLYRDQVNREKSKVRRKKPQPAPPAPEPEPTMRVPPFGPHRKTHIPPPPPKKETWDTAAYDLPEGIILASNVSAAEGFVGEYTGCIGDGGNCASIDLGGMDRLPMIGGSVYAGNVISLHQSLPVPFACHRALVRLNVPGWSPEL